MGTRTLLANHDTTVPKGQLSVMNQELGAVFSLWPWIKESPAVSNTQRCL
jgi:hypothetical protein